MSTRKFHWAVAASMLAIAAASQANAADLGIPVKAAATSDATDGYFFNMQPLGAEAGKTLANYGIYINGRTFNNVVSNVSGGLKTGSFYEGFTLLGFDLDLERIAGIRGAAFHFYANDTNGQNYFPYSGGLYPFNRVWSYNAASRLNEFSYEQTLFDDRVNIRLGRLPPATEFDFSSVYCGFVTGFCAVPAPYAYSKAYPAYNTASWGSVVQVKLTDAYYFNAAAYENEPVLGTVGHYGWPGEDWDFDKANGAVFPMQFGYKTSYANDLYPKSWAVGWFYNTGKYNDPHFNTQGQILAVSGGTPRSDWGNSGFWLQAQQVVWRPDPKNDRGLTLFTGFNYSTSGENNIKDAVFGGASLKGLFAERPNDAINVAGMYIGLNDNFVDNQSDKLIAHGISGSMKNYEAFLELNYQLALAPGMYLQPFVDYVWNPDQVGLAIPNPNVKHSMMVGAAISMSFADALGLPKLKRFGQ